jgi:tripeptide aminopeptidase
MSAAANQRITALAADRALHRAFQWLHLNELRLRQWQLQIMAIPAPPFAEAARAAWFLDRFHELNLTNPHIDAVGNVLATLPATPSEPWALNPKPSALAPSEPWALNPRPSLLLSAHLDTVFPADTVCTPREDGPRLLGPGACDNAAGLTALLALAAALRAAEITPQSPILFCANVGEEGEGDLRGMKHIFGPSPLAPTIAAAIALEGAGTATVVDRALGSRRFRITLTGPGGHSWADAAQPNPIFLLAEAIAAAARLDLPSTPRTTLHCGTIHGGTSINSIPESATATLDLRSISSTQLETTSTALTTLLHQSIDTANLRFTPPHRLHLLIETIGNRPAATLAPDSPLLESLRAVDRHLNITTEPRIGSTDANLPLSLGLPAIAIGTGGTAGGIHTLHEWYDPTGRDLALRRILLHLLDATSLLTPA